MHAPILRSVLTALCVSSIARAQTIQDAHSALDAWQLEDALVAAQEMMLADPENPELGYLAARIQHARGHHVSAVRLVDGAKSAGIDVSRLERLVKGSADYQASMEYVETPHFRIGYLNKDRIVAHFAQDVLERAYRGIGEALEFYPAERGQKIAVEIYPNARGLAAATGLSIKAIETTGTIAVAKFHRLMIISPLATTQGYAWADTLSHEFTHLVISKKSHNSIPIWLHEGIAKYYEKRWRSSSARALGPWSEKLLADATRTGKFITFSQMHPSMALLPSQQDAALAFAQVATVIEYFNQAHGKDSVADILAHTGSGAPLERALKKRLGVGINGIEKIWKQWVRKRKFKTVPGAAPRQITLGPDDAAAREERPLENMDDVQVHNFSRLGELLQLRGHDAAAVIEYEKAFERAGLRYVTLINRLARAYSKTGARQKARTLLVDALKIHPEDADAHLMAGRLAFADGDNTAAENHFEAVKLKNPFNPEIHLAFSQLWEKKNRPEEAQRSREFLELARKPRKSNRFVAPAPNPGAARLSIVTPDWTAVRIDGGAPVPTPAWDLGVSAGEHVIEYLAGQQTKTKSIQLKPGDARVIALR